MDDEVRVDIAMEVQDDGVSQIINQINDSLRQLNNLHINPFESMAEGQSRLASALSNIEFRFESLNNRVSSGMMSSDSETVARTTQEFLQLSTAFENLQQAQNVLGNIRLALAALENVPGLNLLVNGVGVQIPEAVNSANNSFTQFGVLLNALQNRFDVTAAQFANYSLSGAESVYSQNAQGINNLYESLTRAASAQSELVDRGINSGLVWDLAVQRTTNTYEQLSNQIFDVAQIIALALQAAQESGASDAVINRLQQMYDNLANFQQLADAAFASAYQGSQTLEEPLGEDASLSERFAATLESWGPYLQIATQAVNFLVNTLRISVQVAQQLGQAFLTAGNFLKAKLVSGINGITGGLKKGFKFFTKYVLGMRSFFFLVRKVRSMMLTGFKNLAKGSTDVQKQLNMWKGTLEALKLNLGTIIQPIAAALIPVLKVVTTLMQEVAVKVASFIAILTGQKYIYTASKNLQDYADAEAEAAKSTKKHTKELKNQLAAFDEMNVLQDNTDTGDTSGNGSSLDYTGLVSKQAVDMEGAVSKFAEVVKKAWENSDFYDVGKLIGSKLIEAIEMIPWNTINFYAQKVAKSLATLINGFVDSEFKGISIGESLGNAIGQGLNTWVTSVNTFFAKVNWNRIGEELGKSLMAMFGAIDWNAVGVFFTNKLNAIINVAESFFSTVSWEDIATDISTGIKSAMSSIDIDSLTNTMDSIGDALINMLTTMDKEEVLKSITDTILDIVNNIPWDSIGTFFGTSIGMLVNSLADLIIGLDISTLLDGIYNFFTSIASTVDWGKLALAVFDAIVKAFTVAVNILGSLGVSIIQAIFSGISSAIGGMGTWLKTNLIDPFIGFVKTGFNTAVTTIQNIFNPIKTFFSGIITSIINTFTSLPGKLKTLATTGYNNIKNVFSGLAGMFKTIGTNAWKGITNAFSAVGTFFSGIVKSIKNAFSGIANWFKTIFTNAWAGVRNVFSTGGKIFNGIKDGIASTFKNIVNNLITGINKIIAEPFKAINGMLNTIRSANILGYKPFEGLWGKNPLGIPKIPKLAEGAVIPANKEFLAVLGDQKRGTNIEAPLDTIKQALREVQVETGAHGDINLDVTLQVGERQLYRWIKKMEDKQKMVLNG